MEVIQDLIYLVLDIGQQDDIVHDKDMKSFLVLMGDDSEYKLVIGMK